MEKFLFYSLMTEKGFEILKIPYTTDQAKIKMIEQLPGFRKWHPQE
jgi:hypothetical protein